MKQYKWTRETLLEKTNGGLDILLKLYPEGDNGGSGKFPKFKTHDEGHGSSLFFKTREDNYIIKNFGAGDDLSAFDAVIERTPAKDFYEAVQWIVGEFQLEGGNRFGQAELEIIPATKGQKDKDYIFEYRPKLTDLELETVGPLMTQQIAIAHNLKSCKHFIQVKQYQNHKKYGSKLMQIITRSTDNYPILVFDMGDWQKIYQPLNKDKGYRFRYAGNKPKNYLFGKENIAAEYEPLPDHIDENNKDDYDVDNDPRAEVIIIASGDRDALNTASLEYPVVWKNSETEPLSYNDFVFLRDHSRKLCYLGDLDATGKRETVKIALQYVDIAIIHLPEWLTKLSYRGSAQKDMTDFVKAVYSKYGENSLKTQFGKLVKGSLPARFWDNKYNAKGNFTGYDFNNEAVYRFLQYNGYYRMREEASKEAYSFIHIGKNIVRRVEEDEVANFPGNYVRVKKNDNIPLINFIHRSAQLNKTKLGKIDLIEPEFGGTCGEDFQYFFFENKMWKVTADSIETLNYGSNEDILTWESKIIPQSPNYIKDKIFTIFKDSDGDWDIELHKTDNQFLNFLINTSRIHWRETGDKPFKNRINDLDITNAEELKKATEKIWEERDAYRKENQFKIDEAGLIPELIKEQKLNLINKIFAFGYTLHRYKQDSKAWAPFAMDNKISDIGESHGGSGKSIVWHKALKQMFSKKRSYAYINGGDIEGTKDKHLFGNVSAETDVVIFDDLDSKFPMRKVFTNITGEFSTNRKYADQETLDYKESPKTVFTSNFGIYKTDPSKMRRLLFNVFSDYYHYKSDEDKTAWSFNDETGFDLFSKHFTSAMWDDFYSFCAQACQFQMTVPASEKINPPMGNVTKRNSLQSIGDAFHEWANTYFETRKNILVIKNTDAMESLKASGLKNYTSMTFKRNLKEWCKIYGFNFNPEGQYPKGVHNPQGHVKHRIEGKTQECVYIQTYDINGQPVPINLNKSSGEMEESGQVNLTDLTEEEDDMPF